MKAIIEISADGEFCISGRDQCWFMTNSGSFVVCRAYSEPARGKHRLSGRATRLAQMDAGKYYRCDECKKNEVPI